MCIRDSYQGEVAKELPEVDGILGTGSYKDIVDAVETVMAVSYTHLFRQKAQKGTTLFMRLVLCYTLYR